MLGWPRQQIDIWAQQQDPPLTGPAIDAAYAACVETWINAARAEDAEVYALHLARREDLYRRAMAEGDLSLAHKVLVDQARLQQQYRTDQRRESDRSEADERAARIKARAQQLRVVRSK